MGISVSLSEILQWISQHQREDDENMLFSFLHVLQPAVDLNTVQNMPCKQTVKFESFQIENSSLRTTEDLLIVQSAI